MSPSDFDPSWLHTVGFAKPALLSSVAALGFLLVSSVVVMFGVLPGIRKAIEPKRSMGRSLSELVPLRILLQDRHTIAGEDGRLSQVICLEGADIGSMNLARIASLDLNRMSFLKGVREVVSRKSGTEIKFLLERAQQGRLDMLAFPEDQPVMARVSEAWRGGFKKRFVTRYYLVISVAQKTPGAREVLEELYRLAGTSLKEFTPRRLGGTERGASELLGFWNRWLNGGIPALDHGVDSPSDETIAIAGSESARRMGYSEGRLDRMLGRCEVVFNAPRIGMITFQDGNRTRYCRALEVRQFPGGIGKSAMLDILALPIEARVLVQIRPLSQAEVQAEVKQRQMYAGEGLRLRAAQALDEVLEMNEVAWSETRLTIFVFGDTQGRVEEHLDLVRAEISNNHFMEMATVGAGIEFLWQGLFPGKQWIRNESFLPDQAIAELMSFFRANRGFENNDFGPGPVTVFQTALGDMYSFIFHRGPEPEEPGHTMIIGGTGGGKTFLIEFLVGMALRYPKLRTFLFDALQGCYVFTHACGGKYWSLGQGDGASGAASLNPMQMALDNPANKDFLCRWLAILGDVENLPDRDARAMALTDISHAVEGLHQISRSSRSLSYIFNGSFGGSNLRDAMLPWVDKNQRGLVFNGARDSLDLDEGRVVAFDMTHMRENVELLRSVMPYLIHRIRNSVAETGCPYLVVFEETSHMLRIPALAVFIEEELQQARKRHGISILAFQEPEGVTQSPAASAILSNVQTQIFLPNPGAQRERYKEFGLEDHEWSFIAGSSDASSYLIRPILIRKRNLNEGWTSVVVESDLRGRLGDPTLSLFKSGSDYAELCRRTKASFPGFSWIDPYQDEVRRMEAGRRKRSNDQGGHPTSRKPNSGIAEAAE